MNNFFTNNKNQKIRDNSSTDVNPNVASCLRSYMENKGRNTCSDVLAEVIVIASAHD